MKTDTTVPTGRILLKTCLNEDGTVKHGVRLAFPALFETESVNGGKPTYGATLIVPADHPQLAEIRQKMQAVARGKWGDKAAQIYKTLETKDMLGLHDGETKAHLGGFDGNWFVKAAAQEGSRPSVYDKDLDPTTGTLRILTARDGRPYSGCYVHASIEFWPMDRSDGKRIPAQLRGIQFVRDGDAFAAGRPADSDEFEEVTEGAGAHDFA